jgi:thiol:disulfide interchange protein DsbD
MDYGLKVSHFDVMSISAQENDPAFERLSLAKVKKAEMDIVGYNYVQERSFDVLRDAASNPGAAGTMMGAGMGLGMGAPLLVIGASAGSLLPRAGSWMDTVKQVFGVGLLALAIWFIARVVSITTVFYLCSVLLIVSAIYMGALEPVGKPSGWAKLWKGLGLILLCYGILLLIGAASGAGNFFKPLENITRASGNPQNATESHLVFKRIKSVADLDAALQQTDKAGKITMLDFYADWCIECIRMGSSTFTMPEVKSALQNVILLQADVTANDAEDKALLARFGIYGPPAILFFDQDGREMTAYRLFGYSDADKFTKHVNRATGKQ